MQAEVEFDKEAAALYIKLKHSFALSIEVLQRDARLLIDVSGGSVLGIEILLDPRDDELLDALERTVSASAEKGDRK